MVICLERGADLRMAQLMPLPLTVSCFSKIQIGFTFLVPAHLGSPGKRAVKWVCVCVNVLNLMSSEYVAHSSTAVLFILLGPAFCTPCPTWTSCVSGIAISLALGVKNVHGAPTHFSRLLYLIRILQILMIDVTEIFKLFEKTTHSLTLKS